jgi:hypothetical protein
VTKVKILDQRQHNETHQTFFEKLGKSRGYWESNEEGELVQSTLDACMRVITMKPPHIVNVF